jgi:hypothetical protein
MTNRQQFSSKYLLLDQDCRYWTPRRQEGVFRLRANWMTPGSLDSGLKKNFSVLEVIADKAQRLVSKGDYG